MPLVNANRITTSTVTIYKNVYVDLYLGDPTNVFTQSSEVRFRLAEAFRQYKAIYGTLPAGYNEYAFINAMNEGDLMFNFRDKFASITRLTDTYYGYVGTGTLTVYPAGQNTTSGEF